MFAIETEIVSEHNFCFSTIGVRDWCSLLTRMLTTRDEISRHEMAAAAVASHGTAPAVAAASSADSAPQLAADQQAANADAEMISQVVSREECLNAVALHCAGTAAGGMSLKGVRSAMPVANVQTSALLCIDDAFTYNVILQISMSCVQMYTPRAYPHTPNHSRRRALLFRASRPVARRLRGGGGALQLGRRAQRRGSFAAAECIRGRAERAHGRRVPRGGCRFGPAATHAAADAVRAH